MLRVFFIGFPLLVLLVVSAALIRPVTFERPPWELFPDMDRQAKVRFQKPSDFFVDGMASRLPAPGTVPMGFEVPEKPAAEGGFANYGFTHGRDYYNTGQIGDYFGHGMPEQIEVTAEFLERGRERYNINCSVCHGIAGDGKGAVSNYWPTPIGNFHDPRLRDGEQVPDGAIFDTITKGKGLMLAYGGNIAVRDRWAIVAYVRVLQRSQWSEDTPEVRALQNAAARPRE